ncbi:MAG: Uma2 family endonuclease [Leptospiraceae bacterium]|nr:Uma2 family endonuclease [Leptospiraceae bacterium]
MQTSIALELPETFLKRAELLDTLIPLNPGISLQLAQNTLFIEEKELHFSGMDFFPLHLPFKMKEQEMFTISELNSNLRLEMDEEAIIINMGTLGLISAFTAAILITIGIWNRKKKLGKVFDAQSGHDMLVNGKKIHRMPDIAFHLNEVFKEKTLDYRLGFPFFCIEVVSNKKSLKQDLRKMANDWMAAGTEIGLVVCPHREKYYLFEKDVTGYKTYGFSIVFTHSKLPELHIDFAAILEEARGF